MFMAEDEDDDVAQVFIDSLEGEIREIYNWFKFAKKMRRTRTPLLRVISAEANWEKIKFVITVICVATSEAPLLTNAI